MAGLTAGEMCGRRNCAGWNNQSLGTYQAQQFALLDCLREEEGSYKRLSFGMKDDTSAELIAIRAYGCL